MEKSIGVNGGSTRNLDFWNQVNLLKSFVSTFKEETANRLLVTNRFQRILEL